LRETQSPGVVRGFFGVPSMIDSLEVEVFYRQAQIEIAARY
jgi:hypothetical protein